MMTSTLSRTVGIGLAFLMLMACGGTPVSTPTPTLNFSCPAVTPNDLARVLGPSWQNAVPTFEPNGGCRWTNGTDVLFVQVLGRLGETFAGLRDETAKGNQPNGVHTTPIVSAGPKGIARVFYYGASASPSSYTGTFAQTANGTVLQIDASSVQVGQPALDALIAAAATNLKRFGK